MPLNRPSSLTVRVLVNELVKVIEWERLGLSLGIKKHKLQEIKTYRSNNGSLCKLDLLDLWLRSDVHASWSKLVDALKSLDEYNDIVLTLNEKYLGIKPSDFSIDVTASASSENQVTQVSRTTPIATGGEPTPFYRAGGAMNSHPPRQPADGQVVKYVDEVIKGSLNVNEVNPQGTPLLHVVASKNDISGVKVLIAFGAKVDCLNSDKRTTLDCATALEHRGVMELLKRVGGHTSQELKKERMFESSAMEDDDGGDSVRITEEETHHVLCLDSSAEMTLVQLETLEQIEKETGKSILQTFKWLAGSGIGGFLLLMMIYKDKSVADLKVSYFRLWKVLFENKDPSQGKKKRLEDYAYEIFKKSRMGDKDSARVLIGAVDKRMTHLKLKFYTNDDDDGRIPVWEVAYNTCATLEENDDFINGGAICKNLTASALTYISEHQVIKRPQPVTCVVSVGDGIWPSSPFTKSDNFHVCAANALAEQVHENLASQFSDNRQIYYFRFNQLIPEKTSRDFHLESLVDLLVMTIVGFREGSDGSLSLKKLKDTLMNAIY